jgi:basic membrane protein A and related proteins
MNKKWFYGIMGILLCAALVLSSCGQGKSTVSTTTTTTTTTTTSSAPVLIIGALYGGPINDAGYNQAMHESVIAIQANIKGVKIIEAENVPDEAGATSTMENMIQQGAKLIIATAFNHQNPAYALSQKYPNVIFEDAGGYMMGPNFANFYGKPPDAWYIMGIAAGKMTKTNKFGFVAAFPMGWTATFINAFELGAQSVNPKAQTIVAYTFSWGDAAKEADVTNSLINQGCDVITMHVDSPATVISTAESRSVWSIGFQSLAAQKFAPNYWISGTGFTLGDALTKIAASVIDGTWKPVFLRGSMAEGFMAMAPFGPKVPQDVKDIVNNARANMDAGKIVVFTGPITDQDGNIKVAAGQVLSDDAMSSVDWFVQGVIGQPK